MTDASTAISAAPLVALAAPYISVVAGVVVSTLVAMGVAELQKITGLKFQQAAIDALDAKIEDGVGAAVAADAGNLATATITIDHPIVATIAKAIIAEAPDVLARAGVTPASVAGMVHGEIGKWQASMTAVTPAAAVAAPAPTAAPVA